MVEKEFNQKIALVIGASSESLYAINCAQRKGFKVIAFDGNSKAVGLSVADKSVVLDIRKKNELIKILRGIKPDLVLPVPIGACLTTSGYVNDYYGLKGIREDACNNCVDKYLFHQLLSKHGLRNCECFLVNTQANLEPQKYPVILKPRFGSGSRSVIKINNKQEFEENGKKIKMLDEDFICETCMEGQEYGVDASVINGEFNLVLLRKKELTSPPYCQCLGYFSVIPEENRLLISRIKKYMQDLIKVLDINNCLLHADIIDDGEKSFIIELSPRPSGHNLHNDFTKVATSIDMVEKYIDFATDSGKDINFIPPKTLPTLISYFNFENCVITSIPEESYLLKKYPLQKYICNLRKGEACKKIINGSVLMQRGYYILQGSDEKQLRDLRNSLLGEFGVKYD